MTSPRHTDPRRKYLLLYRATDTLPRRPTQARPKPDMPADERRSAELMWEGFDEDWTLLNRVVDELDRDVGVLVERSNVVVLDCDVKAYDDQGFVFRDNRAGLAPQRVEYGIEDLARVVKELGHSMDELATYTVATKSGGYHLYLTQSPAVPITTTRHHREGWRVDVVASVNSWVAAPPTPGYTVARDLPMKTMPEWLAMWLNDVNQKRGPVGGTSRVSLDHSLDLARTAALKGKLEGLELGELHGQYIKLVLESVELANQVGCWNNTIYDAAHRLFDLGLDLEPVLAALSRAAEPDDEGELRKLQDTVTSAWRKNETVREAAR